jgi:hypothetical protein
LIINHRGSTSARAKNSDDFIDLMCMNSLYNYDFASNFELVLGIIDLYVWQLKSFPYAYNIAIDQSITAYTTWTLKKRFNVLIARLLSLIGTETQSGAPYSAEPEMRQVQGGK